MEAKSFFETAVDFHPTTRRLYLKIKPSSSPPLWECLNPAVSHYSHFSFWRRYNAFLSLPSHGYECFCDSWGFSVCQLQAPCLIRLYKINKPTSWFSNTAAHYLVLQRCFAAIFQSYSYYSPPPLRPLFPLCATTLTLKVGQYCSTEVTHLLLPLIRSQLLFCHPVSCQPENTLHSGVGMCASLRVMTLLKIHYPSQCLCHPKAHPNVLPALCKYKSHNDQGVMFVLMNIVTCTIN
jgi:hypothetical protein